MTSDYDDTCIHPGSLLQPAHYVGVMLITVARASGGWTSGHPQPRLVVVVVVTTHGWSSQEFLGMPLKRSTHTQE